MKTVLTVHNTITIQPYTPFDLCAFKHASICCQVHADTSASKKPLTECDPIQLAIFSHRCVTAITHRICLSSSLCSQKFVLSAASAEDTYCVCMLLLHQLDPMV